MMKTIRYAAATAVFALVFVPAFLGSGADACAGGKNCPPPTTSTTTVTTTEPPTTSTSTTTTTTTVTTVPPSTTTTSTTTATTSTTTPPSTTVPPTSTTTSTTVPPPIVTIDFVCENRDSATGEREPVLSWWSGNLDGPGNVIITIANEEQAFPSIEVTAHLPTPGFHDSWIGPSVEIDGHTWTIQLFINDELVAGETKTVTCPAVVEPPVVTDPPPTGPPTGVPTGTAGLAADRFPWLELGAALALLIFGATLLTIDRKEQQ